MVACVVIKDSFLRGSCAGRFLLCTSL